MLAKKIVRDKCEQFSFWAGELDELLTKIHLTA